MGKRGQKNNPLFRVRLTLAEQGADVIANFAGSWTFILIFVLLTIGWMSWNAFRGQPIDPYPYIFLNLLLAIITAFLTLTILMAENRQAQRDHIAAKYDYQINRKAEREIRAIQQQLSEIKRRLRR